MKHSDHSSERRVERARVFVGREVTLMLNGGGQVSGVLISSARCPYRSITDVIVLREPVGDSYMDTAFSGSRVAAIIV